MGITLALNVLKLQPDLWLSFLLGKMTVRKTVSRSYSVVRQDDVHIELCDQV